MNVFKLFATLFVAAVASASMTEAGVSCCHKPGYPAPRHCNIPCP